MLVLMFVEEGRSKMQTLGHEMTPYSRYTIQPSSRVRTALPDPRSLKDLAGNDAPLIESEIQRLFAGYGAKVLYGQRFYAACSSWRGERIQLGDESQPRFAYRVHIFREGAPNVHGRYLGYVSFRPKISDPPNYLFQHTTIAYLSTPTFMLRPRYHIITCNAGPPDGILPFRATPFAFPNIPFGGRAACLHAALHQAILLKMDAFGLTPLSSQDMIGILWEMHGGQHTPQQILAKGATLEEALKILRHDQVRGGGVVETIDVRNQGSVAEVLLEAIRCMTDWLANGLPLVVGVQYGQSGSDAHALMIFGMHLMNDPEDFPYVKGETELKMFDAYKSLWAERRVDMDELPGRLVVHDINRGGPFVELPTLKLLIGSWVGPLEGNGGISFLAVGPQGMKIGVHGVRQAAGLLMLGCRDEFWREYAEAHPHLRAKIPPRTESVRFVTRFLRTGQVQERYFHQRRDGVLSLDQEAWNRVNATGVNEKNFWWSVEVRFPQGGADSALSDRQVLPALVYLWSVEDEWQQDQKKRLPSPRATIHYLARVEGQDTLILTTSKDGRGYKYVPFPQRS